MPNMVLLGGLLKASRADEAHKLLDEMPKRNVVLCPAMLFGYIQDGRVA